MTLVYTKLNILKCFQKKMLFVMVYTLQILEQPL